MAKDNRDEYTKTFFNKDGSRIFYNLDGTVFREFDQDDVTDDAFQATWPAIIAVGGSISLVLGYGLYVIVSTLLSVF